MFVIMIIHQSLLEPFPRWDGGLCWCFVFRCLFSFVWWPWFVWWHWFCFSWLVGFAFELPASVLIYVTLIYVALILFSFVFKLVVFGYACLCFGPLAWLCLLAFWSPLAWLTTRL